MSIEVRQLRYAVMTADKRSFARAAQALNTKQSTLSKKVAELEIRLGIKLFERTTNGASPTEAAKTFLATARRIVTDVDNLVTTAKNMRYGQQGRLAIGYSSPLIGGNLHASIGDYLNRYKDVQFDAVEKDPADLLNGLQLRTLDAAIVAADLSSAEIKQAFLWSERLLLALPESHALAGNERVHWSDLKREPIVLPQNGMGVAIARQLASRMMDQGLRTNTLFQEASHETILNTVQFSRFATVVPDSMRGVPWPGVIFKEVHDAIGQAHLDFSVYWHEDNENGALKYFFRLLKERYPSINLG